MSARHRVDLPPAGIVRHHDRKVRRGYEKMVAALAAGNIAAAIKWQHWNAHDTAKSHAARTSLIHGEI